MGNGNRTGAVDPADSLCEHRDEPTQFMVRIAEGNRKSRGPQLSDEIELS
jgi:hypothetical protein